MKSIDVCRSDETLFPVFLAWLFALAFYGAAVEPCFAEPIEAVPTDGFQGNWYSNGSGANGIKYKYSGGNAVAHGHNEPVAVYSAAAQKTFFGFLADVDPGPRFRVGHAVSYYDHRTGRVARPRLWYRKETGDSHDALVMAIDDKGFIYLFVMTHGEARESQICRSARPFDLTAYEELLTPDDPADQATFGPLAETSRPVHRFSYANAWYLPNAAHDDKFLLLHTRYQDSPGGKIAFNQRDLFSTTSRNGDQWTPRRLYSCIEEGQYQSTWPKADGRTVGAAFNVHPLHVADPDEPLNARTDLFYMETSDQARTWRTIDGVVLVDNSGLVGQPLTSRPVGPEAGAAQAYQATPGERVYNKQVAYDADGNPALLFVTSPSHLPGNHGGPAPDRFVKVARWTGRQWSVHEVTTTDHNYDVGVLTISADGVWRITGTFIDGPQPYGVGGEVGEWISRDEGKSWKLERQITYHSRFNHAGIAQPLNWQGDFSLLWNDGDAFAPSPVRLYFADDQGRVFQLPFHMDEDFAAPEPLDRIALPQ